MPMRYFSRRFVVPRLDELCNAEVRVLDVVGIGVLTDRVPSIKRSSSFSKVALKTLPKGCAAVYWQRIGEIVEQDYTARFTHTGSWKAHVASLLIMGLPGAPTMLLIEPFVISKEIRSAPLQKR